MSSFQDYFDALTTPLGGTVTAVVVLGNLSTWFIAHRLTIAVEAYKGGLQKELTKVSAELTTLNKRQEVAFTWLHTNRAQVLIEIYSKIAEMEDMVNDLARYNDIKESNPEVAKIMNHSENIPNKLAELIADYNLYMKKNRLLFDDSTATRLTDVGLLIMLCVHFESHSEMSKVPVVGSLAVDMEELVGLDIEKVRKKIQEAMEEIRKQFRDFLSTVT